YNVQLDGDGNHIYVSGGPEISPVDMMGIQLGPSYRGASDGYASRIGLHLATYGAFTFPFLSPFVGLRVNFPLEGGKTHGWEVAFIASLRGSFMIQNNGCIDQSLQCLYVVEGRPLRVGGRQVTARGVRGDGWTASISADTAGLGAAERRELAAEW